MAIIVPELIMSDIEDLFMVADEAGIRLEVIDGLPVWEVSPGLTHQESVDRVRQSIRADEKGGGCECLHYADLHIRFPDGSNKRPDVSIFCHRPAETDSTVTEVPPAVIEVLSKGYERKDLELAPPFYFKHGVRDVIVHNPYSRATRHFTGSGYRDYAEPVTIALHCGCRVTI